MIQRILDKVRKWLGIDIDKEPREDLQRWRKNVEEAREICRAKGIEKLPPSLAPATEACLRTAELKEFARGNKLSKERVDHIRQCRRCRILLPEALQDE